LSSYTEISSDTFVFSRTIVLDDHFELFFRCSDNMSDSDVEKHLFAIDRHELQAVGVYIEENGYRIAEVELRVDWKKHIELIKIHGNMFDTCLPGWKPGWKNHRTAPEAYVAVGHLAREAKNRGLEVRHWISVSDRIRESDTEHKRVCNELGYEYGSSVAPWKNPPIEHTRQIQGLPEGSVTTRRIS